MLGREGEGCEGFGGGGEVVEGCFFEGVLRGGGGGEVGGEEREEGEEDEGEEAHCGGSWYAVDRFLGLKFEVHGTNATPPDAAISGATVASGASPYLARLYLHRKFGIFYLLRHNVVCGCGSQRLNIWRPISGSLMTLRLFHKQVNDKAT